MLAVVISLLFGLVAFAALAQIWLSVGAGMRRARMLQAQLASAHGAVRAKSVRRLDRPSWQPRLAAA